MSNMPGPPGAVHSGLLSCAALRSLSPPEAIPEQFVRQPDEGIQDDERDPVRDGQPEQLDLFHDPAHGALPQDVQTFHVYLIRGQDRRESSCTERGTRVMTTLIVRAPV